MRQALHIFKKDVRYLWREVLLLLLLAAILGWAERHSLSAWWAEVMFTLAAANGIARLVHAEAIPGHNQFWITRPYRWRSLLGAKLLFILIFVNLPVFAAQWYVIASMRFPLADHFAGLLWSQVLMLLCITLPIAALASATAGAVPFTLSAFVAAVIGFIGSSQMMLFFFGPRPRLPSVPYSIGWVSQSLAVAAITCISAVVLYLQYRSRRTNFSRIFAIAAGVVAVVAYFFMPWGIALGVQSLFSRQAVDAASIRLSLDPSRKGNFPIPGREKVTQVELMFPIAIDGIPDAAEPQCDALSFTVQGADGRTWNSGFLESNPVPDGARRAVLNGYCLMDPSFFRDEGGKPVTLRTDLYLTLFGNTQSSDISIEGGPVNVVDGLRCGTGLLHQLYCRSAFRWPRRRVYAKFGAEAGELFDSLSYSPFPAVLDFNPIEAHWVSTSPSASRVTIVTKEPVSHFRSRVEIPNVRLSDFTKGARLRK
jgi:hypothetical protein